VHLLKGKRFILKENLSYYSLYIKTLGIQQTEVYITARAINFGHIKDYKSKPYLSFL